ncbi:CsbD family protein [Facklamia miroungae]|uniref:CsbD-like n=1 Tax=Facklamia miroungae TaxID=120956 RepID=A0A1G7SRX5_9LACT|nr:CsbD family protein [Facklamia miroungae]NKZ29561.1 CsbD family protein [Facklamia miroungae]SDG25773.1 CsbD-like [Facklamia miroungae]
MSEEKKNAKLEKLAGSVKEAVGKVTDNKELQSEGMAEKVKGTVKEGIEDAKDAVDGLKKGLSDKE